MSLTDGPKDNVPQTAGEWLECLELPEYVKMIPAGKIQSIVGPVIWVDGNGENMAEESYFARYGFHPQVAWDAIKEYRRLAGKADKIKML